MDINELREIFEDNFEELKMESSRSITLNMKEYAWQQVLLYHEKLLHVAEKVTETEVRLILPEQLTPSGKSYTIEGVVDIVQEGDKVTMYDIKTHNNMDVKANSSMYKGQLNVYSHIWQNLRNSSIDTLAIIATAPPQCVRDAIAKDDKELLEKEMNKWEPIVKLDFDQSEIDKHIKRFGETVDKIENGEFSAPKLDKLKQFQNGQKTPFGTAVCRHCDARYSCASYDLYINKIELSDEILKEIAIVEETEKESWKLAYEI